MQANNAVLPTRLNNYQSSWLWLLSLVLSLLVLIFVIDVLVVAAASVVKVRKDLPACTEKKQDGIDDLLAPLDVLPHEISGLMNFHMQNWLGFARSRMRNVRYNFPFHHNDTVYVNSPFWCMSKKQKTHLENLNKGKGGNKKDTKQIVFKKQCKTANIVISQTFTEWLEMFASIGLTTA